VNENQGANMSETTSLPNAVTGLRKKLRWVEYGFLVLWLAGLIAALNDVNFFGRSPENIWRLLDPYYQYWVGLVTLALWTAAPLILRPFSTPWMTLQQRYALLALTLGSGLVWLLYLSENLQYNTSLDYVSRLGILATVGLIAVAGFLRLGWKKQSRP
jgi:hypothetical protein